MKIAFNIEERRYLSSLLITVAVRTPNLPRNNKRALRKIASKMGAILPNLKPMERISIFQILAMGAGMIEKQRLAAVEVNDGVAMQRAETVAKMVSEIVSKLGVVNEEPSEVDARDTAVDASNG